jgi:hypothetical protein
MSLPLALGSRSSGLWLFLLAGLGVALLSSALSEAKVFYAKDEALKVAFPNADQVEMKTFILRDAEIQRAEKLSRARMESKLFTFYIGRKSDKILGYAAIDTHTVRTLPETFMVVLSPEGRLKSALILAFHEPPEYQASERWLHQFENQNLSDELAVGRNIAGIAGSTLTTHAITQGIRKVLALFQILIQEKR